MEKRGRNPRGVKSPIKVVVLEVKYESYLKRAVRGNLNGLIPGFYKFCGIGISTFRFKVIRDL